jgi:hypothetical protein
MIPRRQLFRLFRFGKCQHPSRGAGLLRTEYTRTEASTGPQPANKPGPNGTALALRDFDLGGAKPILPGGRSVRCSLLNQQAFRLEKKFEMDHGFHRTPLVPGCLEALQYVSPGVARPRASCRRRFGNPIRRPPVEPEADVKELIRANADTLLTRVLARSPSRGPSASPGAASAFA